MHLRMEKSNWLGAMRKYISEPFQEGPFLSSSMTVSHEKNVKFLHFEFVKWVTQMKRHLKKKQFELLHNALGIMAPELADVEDSFRQRKQCSAHAQLLSSQISVSSFSLQINTSESENVSFLSSSHDLSIGVPHTIICSYWPVVRSIRENIGPQFWSTKS